MVLSHRKVRPLPVFYYIESSTYALRCVFAPYGAFVLYSTKTLCSVFTPQGAYAPPGACARQRAAEPTDFFVFVSTITFSCFP